MAFGKVGKAWLFGLPGNPVAVMVSYTQFALDALLRLSGLDPVPARPLLSVASANVIKKPAKQNLLTVTRGDDTTGLLAKNLVVTRGKPPKDGNGERYLVRVRRKSYLRKGAKVTTLKTAQLLEYGSSQQLAEPWLRPAFEQNAVKAIETTRDELLKAIDKIVNRLGKG